METNKCKYCGVELQKVLMPPESDWGVEYFMVCMNDDCQYYVRGWKWMEENYRVKASYRYKFNPENNDEGPLPVRSAEDYKNFIVHKF